MFSYWWNGLLNTNHSQSIDNNSPSMIIDVMFAEHRTKRMKNVEQKQYMKKGKREK